MESHFIYNPDNVGSHCHSPSLTQDQTSIYLAWYAYPEKEHEEAQICIARKSKKEKSSWETSRVAFDEKLHSTQGNPVIFFDPKSQTLHLFFVILKWTYWDSAKIMHSQWNENDKSWSRPQSINTPEGVMLRHRPLLYEDKALFPAYDEKTLMTQYYESHFPFEHWKLVSQHDTKTIQADLIELSPNEIISFMRAAGDHKRVYRSLSADRGHTWSSVMETTCLCPLSGIAAIKMNPQTIIVAHNNTEAHSRGHLSLSVTHNCGQSFKTPYPLEGDGIEVSYPTLLRINDEEFAIAYTYNRKMIKFVTMTYKELSQIC